LKAKSCIKMERMAAGLGGRLIEGACLA